LGLAFTVTVFCLVLAGCSTPAPRMNDLHLTAWAMTDPRQGANGTLYVEIWLDHAEADPVLERLEVRHAADHWIPETQGPPFGDRQNQDCASHDVGGCRVWTASGGPAWPLDDMVEVHVDAYYKQYDTHYGSLVAKVPIQRSLD